MHPAQGLRVGKRCFHEEYEQLFAQPTYERANTLAQQIKQHLSPNQHTDIKIQGELRPEHFLLETQLPQPLNSLKGYVSPILNVQPDIHFIRTQRRYNKRRYARVRAVSRPSF